MTSQGPVTPHPLPLLVKDNNYAVDTTRSIVQDANLDGARNMRPTPWVNPVFMT